jgi:mannose-6-phosphate isomerase
MHSYIQGFGLEIMANSDNVLRGGLTKKYTDLRGLASILNFAPSKPVVIHPAATGVPGWEVYETRAGEFTLGKLTGEGPAVPLPAGGPAIVIVTEGEAVSADLTLKQGESAFAPQGETVRFAGRFTLYAAFCPCPQ